MQAALLPRWSYRSYVLSPLSGLPATVRLVLVALDNYRSDRSPVPFPSQKALAGDTGLGERTVRDALAIAGEQGWLSRVPRYRPHGGGRLADAYELMVPDSIAALSAGKGSVPATGAEHTGSSRRGSSSVVTKVSTDELTIPLRAERNNTPERASDIIKRLGM